MASDVRRTTAFGTRTILNFPLVFTTGRPFHLGADGFEETAPRPRARYK